MAVDPKLIMMAIEAANNEKVRRTALYIVFFVLGLIMLVFVMYGGMMSGLFAVVQNNSLKIEWAYYSKSISDVFKEVKGEISADVKDEVYDFMPDFPVNLSKAMIGGSLGDDALILFDENDMYVAYNVMNDYASQLREIKSQSEFDSYISGFDTKLSFSEINRSEFAEDSGVDNIGNYNDNLKKFLYNRAMGNIPKCTYTVEAVTVDGKNANRQTLTVTDDKTKTVEYTCIGGNIYLPEFLAMYNVHQTQNYLIGIAEEDTHEIDKQIEEIVGGIPDTSEDFQDYLNGTWDKAINGGKDAAGINIFETAALKAVIKKANLNGAAKVTMRRGENKLSITLETIDSDTWKEIFGIDQSLWDYVEQTKMTIEMALDAAKIPIEERTISLDSIVQLTLFEYFDGLFESPADNSAARGILSQYGSTSKLHKHNGSNVTDKGMTLRLGKKTSIYASLQENCKSVIKDAFIYDVWDMDEMDIGDDNKLYNRSAVTVAYIIDTKRFEKVYGFPFPHVDGVVTDSGYVTMFLEFSCLNNTNFEKSDVGSSVSDNLRVGNSHDGMYNEIYDSGSWQHSGGQGDCVPHVGIKVHIKSGETTKPTTSKDDTKYSGPGVKDIGVAVNPRLWFKGLGSGTSGELLDNVSAVMPK